jgi:hypothetical protein
MKLAETIRLQSYLNLSQSLSKLPALRQGLVWGPTKCLAGPQHCEHNISDIRLLQRHKPVANFGYLQAAVSYPPGRLGNGDEESRIFRDHDHAPHQPQDPNLPRHHDCPG